MKRGEVWWASLPLPFGRRPVVIVQSNPFNQSRLKSVVVALVTSNLSLESAPGNVRLPEGEGGVRKASVVNVTQLLTIDRALLVDQLGMLTTERQQRVDAGLRLVLGLTGRVDKPGVMEAAAEYAVRARRVSIPRR
jgi:mRNA interferase MazF